MMNSTPRPYTRRIFVVNKSLQYRFIAWVLGTILVAVAMVLADVFISLRGAAEKQGLSLILLDLYDPRHPLTLGKLIFYSTGVFLASVLLSHRLAGPIYRFEKSTRQVASGDLTQQVFLRKRDELLDLRNAFNEMVESLRGKVAGDVERALRARQALEGALKVSPLPEEAAAKIRLAVAEMERMGKDFKIA